MNTRTLTAEQIEHFVAKGYVHIKGAFDREDALKAQDFLWAKLEERYEIRKDEPGSYRLPMANLQEVYRTEAFDNCNSVKFADAVEDLQGAGRVRNRWVAGEREDLPGWGWWPVNFSYGAGEAWTVPTIGWHWDGIHFRHYVDAPDQGLLCLCLFSDIGPRGGGTLIVEGSHRPIARHLAKYPDGVVLEDSISDFVKEHPYFGALTGQDGEKLSAEERVERFMNQSYVDTDGTELRVLETGGEAGDVLLCHPFLFHAASPNHSSNVRFMCNRTAPLKEKLVLNRENRAEESPLERSIRLAIEA